MKQKKYFLFYLLIFLLNIKFFSSQYSFYDRFVSFPNETQDSNTETTHISETKDMGPCTCNLTSHCDFRCCCDTKCSETIRKEWQDKKICINKNKKRMDAFKCDNAENNFNYNKKEAGITVKDHIFNIMCIQYDRSGDMGNFYSKNYDDREVSNIKEEWINNFLDRDIKVVDGNNKYKYGNRTNNIIYKADSNGNCIKQYISYLIPFESECSFPGGYTDNNINDIFGNINYVEGVGNSISDVTVIINYSNDLIPKVYALRNNNNNREPIKFKVKWIGNDNGSKNYPYGYIQGKPIKIASYTEENGYSYYENGFPIGISNNINCVENINESKELSMILFKNSAIFSCQYRNGSIDTYILNSFCNNNLKIGKYLNSSLLINEDWITLNINCSDLDNERSKDIDINLLILTSKDGEENSLYEYIEYATLNIAKKETENRIISLNIKFVELSHSSIINSKEGKITSLIPLSDETLDLLSKK